MHINTESLSAFLEIQKFGSFTKAAQKLGISQSALSQKIARLEDLLQVSLFIRGNGEILLTSSGEKLRIFAKQQINFEETFINQFDQDQNPKILTGTLRVAGFSSIMRSVIMPALSQGLRENPKATIEFSSFEVVELETVLKRNQADLIITDYRPTVPGLESMLIGHEEYVVVESRNFKSIPNVYLDHGPHDNATESFFMYQGLDQPLNRGFMGDVYGIIEGVKLGLGKAVMSKHLIKDFKEIRMKKFKKRYLRKVYLSFYKQGYYSPLHKFTVEKIRKNSNDFL